MKNENEGVYYKTEFVIREKVLDLDCYIRAHIVNAIPAVNRDIRIHILDELYNIVKNLHYAIYTKGNVRIKYLTDVIVNISLLDYLFTIVSKYKNINELKLREAIKKLLDVRNMIKKWKTTEEAKKNEKKYLPCSNNY